MRDEVDEGIFQLFPDYIRAIVVAQGIDNQGVQPDVEEMLREAETQCEALFAQENLTTHPRIASWREAYKTLNMKPGKNYSSVEALARRARGGAPLPYINTLVALMNAFSLKHLVPCGGDDLDAARGDLVLRLANGDERFVPLGKKEVEHPEPGEAVYVDEQQVLCRRWNWRQGDRTKLTPSTRHVLVNIDCLPPVDGQEAQTLVIELAALVERCCGGSVRHFLISASKPAVGSG
ncbi:MAG TPA: phenylalanine--tRNA ligase beta subunit-related protein [Anaerolineae bacterium]|nr:phenylalanine--tRNA ligase beta subunit-related protein [Anaerolineae bacterium]